MPDARPVLLVVDDEAINIDILLEALGKDYTVRVATDGAAALDSVAKAVPDLILMDVMMPGMDGFTACRRLKEDPSLRDVPIIFLTSRNDTPDKVTGLSIGGVDYITKPFEFEEIRVRIATHLELKRQKHELQQSYDRLRELEMLRDNLVHMIVHDMRSPLSSIFGYLEMAEMTPLPEGVAAYIKNALKGTGTLLEMVSNLLDVSKMEAGQMTLDFSAIDLKKLAAETIRMIEPLLGQRKLILQTPDEIESLRADMPLIQRILQNLIGNAIKFTDRKRGEITVSIEPGSKDMVRISVTDNGRGIAPECHDKVFDKFWQMEARKQGKMHSTGLGLTFCKLAVEAHGGRIGLNSDGASGSTFWFDLPIR